MLPSTPAARRAFAFATILALTGTAGANAQLIPTPPPAASPAPEPLLDDSHVIALVKAEFDRWRAGKVDRTKYTPVLSIELTDDQVERGAEELRPLGAPVSFTLARTTQGQGDRVFQYIVKCERGRVLFTITFNAKNQEDGVFLRPL
jgi:hypothetical protein